MKTGSTWRDVQAQHFARLAFGSDLERAAADFAVGGEPLARHAGVNAHLGGLAAERAGNGFKNFHVLILTTRFAWGELSN